MNLADPRKPWDDAEPGHEAECIGCDRLATDLDGCCDRCSVAGDPFLAPIVERLLDEQIAESARAHREGLLIEGHVYIFTDHDYGDTRVYRGEAGPDAPWCHHDGSVESIVQAILEVMP